ncbi:Maf-like protein [[Pseudomonas] boreopolis]|uniref:dTTP/UTP pyrophosphatase n=2 Tax=Xanthomonas boreopolis TaxID=86183 RepID=A0A919KJE1_9XANT|nr:Maf-like protein [[Pseudomonas] boreopolis]
MRHPARDGSGYACRMLYLASRSPRRKELLARLGVAFETLDLDVPEVRGEGEPPAGYVRRVALEKARAGLAQVGGRDPQAVVLGSDTEVVLGDRVFGKPVDRADAIAMLQALSGRTHEVITAVALVAGQREPALAEVVSRVTFAGMTARQIEAYVDTGEPMGKAGAYAIQGGGERFVVRLEGSFSAVMGLPLHHTSQLLAAFGGH